MSLCKKILLGVVLLLAPALALVMGPHKAFAATANNDQWSACVYQVTSHPSITDGKCKTDDPHSTNAMVYGGLEASVELKNATYKGSTTMHSVTSGSVTLQTPETIEILNSSGSGSIFSGSFKDEALTCGVLQYDSVANTLAQYDGTSTVYEVYIALGQTTSNCGDFVFLTTFNKDETMSLLAIAERNLRTGNPDFVYADSINKQVQGVTSGGLDEGGGGGGGGGSTAKSCESNFTSGFEWIICPSLKLADKAAGGFNSFVEGQLTVCTGQSSTQASGICANSILGDQTHLGPKNAWSIFKNIASALLVIIVLVAVISQALNVGPFDAYTIRKILPKVVAAVILIQVSWYMLKYAVDLSNDLGKGIQNLLYAPFGGSGNMDLDKLVANSVSTHGTGTNDTWAFFTTLAGGGALLANLPGLLTLGLFVVVALVVAFLVLLLRKIFILTLILLAPVAFILWILPGTNRYWKMWSENFTKLLLMFPMIMALVATGRIFAYVVSNPSSPPAHASLSPHLAVAHLGPLPLPYFGSVESFVDIAIIVFAYFAPYFLLPQTFKWGGQFMSAASQAVNNRVAKPITDKSREGIKGITERYHGKMGKAYDPNANLGSRVFRRVGSGHFIPSKRSQRLAIAEGDKWSQMMDEQAQALIKRKGEKVMVEGYTTVSRNKRGEMLDAAGNVTKDVTLAAKVKLTGVQAMKQMWVDLAEDGRDSFEKKMAIRQLTATSSWPEVQGAFTTKGKRVIDTDAWAPSITTSLEDYPRVLRSRVDAAPHIEDKARSALAGAKSAGRAFADQYDELDFKSQYRVQYAIEKQMSNEDFQTQSDGFWDEAARLMDATQSNITPAERAALQTSLRARFDAIQKAGPTTRQQMLGHLAAGGTLQANVEAVLGASVNDYINGAGPP